MTARRYRAAAARNPGSEIEAGRPRAVASADVAWTVCVFGLGALITLAGAVIWRNQTGAGLDLGSIAGWGLPRSLGDLEHLVALAFCAFGIVTLLWWTLSLLAALSGALLLRFHRPRAAQLVARWSPAYMRRLAVAVLGVQLIAAPGAFAADLPASPVDAQQTAHVAPSPAWSAVDEQSAGPTTASPSARTDAEAPSPAWQPGSAVPQLDRVLDSAPLAHDATPVSAGSAETAPSPAWKPGRTAPEIDRVLGATRTAGDEVVVAHGDTLWSLAADSLGPDATTAEIAAEWPRWHAANRDVIGPDPDRLTIGTVLERPASSPVS